MTSRSIHGRRSRTQPMSRRIDHGERRYRWSNSWSFSAGLTVKRCSDAKSLRSGEPLPLSSSVSMGVPAPDLDSERRPGIGVRRSTQKGATVSYDPPVPAFTSSPPGRPWSPPESALPMAQSSVPVAWLGRTSTEDTQDPTLSLPRQLRNARAALPPGWVIVAHFYDVESGRKDLKARGQGRAHEQFNISVPRDGGITDLLDEARSPDRRFAAVICESIERVARRTYFGTKVEYELEQAGVALCAADEPILTDGRAKRATPTLTRRVKQAVAEWYVLQMLELSWDGFIQHIEQGWNIGKPPYGYLAERVPHPVPAKRAQGLTKHRLVPDPSRGYVVTEIFRMRVLRRLSYGAITDCLNQDLTRYPPPAPNRADTAKRRWTRSAVRSILENPKYTGYQVWNRKARKRGNRANPISEWIWSSRPTHEPLVTRQLFDAAWPNSAEHPGVRKERAARTNGASMDRFYILRSYVFCAICDRRMHGKSSKGRLYYACQPKKAQDQDAEWYSSHPSAVWISERVLLDAIHRFFEDRIFGPDRHQLLADMLTAAAAANAPADTTKAQTLAAEAARLTRQKEALLDQLVIGEAGDGDPETTAEFRRGIRKRFDALEQRRRAAQAKAEQIRSGSGERGAGDPDLLCAIPQLSISFAALSEGIRREIFDSYRLRVRYDGRDRGVRIEATITAAVAPDLAAVVERTGKTMSDADQPISVRPRQDSNLRPSA
ncbi:recombinase family protein [Streptomyces triticagri]|uniref:recombinase family protein n=1 Tax=Streptomyces triticagri TaxID=2293568 RepID=UPI002D773AB1|nr:recombinase family protein [Streptomyces triticagri]